LSTLGEIAAMLAALKRTTRTRRLRAVPLPCALLCLCGLFCASTPVPLASAAESDSVFGSFTKHIQRQILSDKRLFLEAETCTAWFYEQQHNKPAQPPVQGVSYPPAGRLGRSALETSDCPQRYPGGLRAARQEFGRTQALLSISLTFYQFALVGDRNDDEQYSVTELQDIVESLGLRFDAVRRPAVYLAVLNTQFEAMHKTGSLEGLMAGMGTLLDRGYRLTPQDRSALNRISQ